ncbi:MAG: glycogen/starch/alpha-glucan phosphorylase [Deltaproteobacteria bacterium]|nr:glycogen/starch/alpha-glucan phosphorylase [Deltaproteobacteria bacterium]
MARPAGPGPKTAFTAIRQENNSYGPKTESIKQSFAGHLKYTIGKDAFSATGRDYFHTVAYTVRDYLIDKWLETHRSYHYDDAKRVYYISMEFLIGKTLENSIVNLGIESALSKVVKEYGADLNEIISIEDEAGLGNGGLGRLAACFLDSMASMDIPGYGYGIRFEYGMFRQQIKDGRQVEHPDNWLRYGNPWEFPRPEYIYPVKYRGRIHEFTDEKGARRHEWVDCETVMAMAYDIPVPGYRCTTVNNLRLWSAKSSRDFNLEYFNHGDYIKAVEDKNGAERISKILYPNDNSPGGKTLRLMQEYFLVSATLQDIFRRFKNHHASFSELPDKVAIQLNDTHPSLAVPELMRLLVDTEGLGWDQAWDITVRTISYTNHTVLPEALEKWPVKLLEEALPRHLQIIHEINHRFLKEVYSRYPGDIDRLKRMSVIEEGDEKMVRMANLSIVGSYRVNGVAAIHSEILKNDIFPDFSSFYPGKFTNKTNGISQRVWLKKANKPLSSLISARIGPGWVTDLFELKKLARFSEDKAFCAQWRGIKAANKEALGAYIEKTAKVKVNPASLFDVHVKRIHEYKRQLLNVLHIVTLYNRCRENPLYDMTPRTFIFSGKAAPGYGTAKKIIHLINAVAGIVNNDPSVGGRLKVVFLPDYNVSLAERIIPAADLSEQISTAGTEASGTGCMKLALNGALTIGTLDGANIEMREEIGAKNFFAFGLSAAEVVELKKRGYDPYSYCSSDPELKRALDMIGGGFFSPDNLEEFRDIVRSLTDWGDNFMVLADYAGYVKCQERVSGLYKDPDEWTRISILNVASMGKFSSDRTIREYAEEIWGVKSQQRGADRLPAAAP